MDSKLNLKRGSLLAIGLTASFALAPVAQAITYDLVAMPFTKTMPDGVAVPMWGFALTGTSATAPGPQLVVPPGDATGLTINLTNNLGVPVSIVIPGQPAALTPVMFPPDAQGRQRVRSLTAETLPGTTQSYSWPNVQPGTYLYHSGTHPQVQVQMGLYGVVKHDAVAGQAYPWIGYANEAVVFYSEIDPVLHAAVAGGRYGQPVPDPLPAGLTAEDYPSSTINYAPKYFLINGAPYSGASLPIPAGNVGQPTLVRFLNASLRTHVPVLNGQYLSLVAEDGKVYPYAKEQYSVILPALKTVDAIFAPTAQGSFALYDGRLDLTTNGYPNGGMLAFLSVGAPAPGVPVAVNDAYVTNEDTVLSVVPPGVLGNDSGGLTVPLSAVLLTDVTNGTLWLSQDGAFTYTPNANYVGADSFTYQATDGTQNSLAATVSLTVNPVNDAPSAAADAYTVVAGGLLNMGAPGVLANDSDVDGDPLTAVLASQPVPELLLNSDGSFTYQAPPTPTTFSFAYQANDGSALSAAATVTITVTANTAPVAVDDFGSTAKNVALTITVLANDYDPDTANDQTNTIAPGTVRVGNDLLTVQTQRGGTATVDSANDTIVYQPKLHFRGTDLFTYTMRDTYGAISNVATVRVNVK